MTARVFTESLRGTLKIVWASLAKSENGDTAWAPHYPDKSVLVEGDFDSASVTIQGRNDGGSWMTLHDPQGNDLIFAEAGAKLITENTEEIRPSVDAGGAGTTNIKVSIIANRGW